MTFKLHGFQTDRDLLLFDGRWLSKLKTINILQFTRNIFLHNILCYKLYWNEQSAMQTNFYSLRRAWAAVAHIVH